MQRSEIENVSPEVEMLARMWMQCDPNRGGSDPDELSTLHVDGIPEDHPRWMWFIPRAEASIAHFEAGGYSLRRGA